MRFACFVALALCVTAAFAKDGRDFAGHFALTGISQKGSQVGATLVLQLFNDSGADLKQAVVSVRPTASPSREIGRFAAIKLWREGQAVTISRPLEIPHDEFKRWSGRSQPSVFVLYRDASGHSRRAAAQLSRRPLSFANTGAAN